MKFKMWTFDQAYVHVKQRRPIVEPNPGFVEQLREYFDRAE